MFDLQALDLALSNCDAYDAGILCDGNSPKYDTPRLLLCSGQLIPDTELSFSSATAGANPALN